MLISHMKKPLVKSERQQATYPFYVLIKSMMKRFLLMRIFYCLKSLLHQICILHEFIKVPAER